MSERGYDTPPKNRASLEQRLRNLIGEDALQLRARRQIGYIGVIAALGTHARNEDGEPVFAIKGGVAVELLMGQEARATKDLDAAVRAQAEEIAPLLRDALARGWDGFSFRLVSWEPIHDTAAWRGDIKLQFKASRSPPCSSRQPPPGAPRAGARNWSTTPSSTSPRSASPGRRATAGHARHARPEAPRLHRPLPHRS